MTTRAEIAAAALSLVGTPFHAQGRQAGVGVDCVGVVVVVARMCGLTVEDRAAYPMNPNGEMPGELDARLTRVYGEPQEGDVLMMQMKGMTSPHHVAIALSGNRIVHAHNRAGKCVEQTYTRFWQSAVRAVYRFPGIE